MAPAYCTHCGKPLKEGAEFCAACGTRIPKTAQASPPPSSPSLPSSASRTKNVMSARTKVIYGIGLVLLFAGFLYFFVDHLPGGEHPVIEKQPSIAMATMYMGQVLQPSVINATVDGDQIIFPLSLLQEHKIVEFEYRGANSVVPLLAYIAADGRLVTSIRMCEPCNSNHFRIEGLELTCAVCGTQWKLNNLEGVQGSCQKYPPDPVPSVVRTDRRSGAEVVAIDLNAVRNWKMRI